MPFILIAGVIFGPPSRHVSLVQLFGCYLFGTATVDNVNQIVEVALGALGVSGYDNFDTSVPILQLIHRNKMHHRSSGEQQAIFAYPLSRCLTVKVYLSC